MLNTIEKAQEKLSEHPLILFEIQKIFGTVDIINEAKRLKQIETQIAGAIDNNPQNVEYVIQIFNHLKVQTWPEAIAEIQKMKTAIEELPQIRTQLYKSRCDEIARLKLVDKNHKETECFRDVVYKIYVSLTESLTTKNPSPDYQYIGDYVANEFDWLLCEYKKLIALKADFDESMRPKAETHCTHYLKLQRFLNIIASDELQKNDVDLCSYAECLKKDSTELLAIKKHLGITDLSCSALPTITAHTQIVSNVHSIVDNSDCWVHLREKYGITNSGDLLNEIDSLFRLREEIRDSSDYQSLSRSDVAQYDPNDSIERQIIRTLHNYQNIRELLTEVLTPVNVEQLRDKIHLLNIYEESRTIPIEDARQFGELKAALAKWDQAA